MTAVTVSTAERIAPEPLADATAPDMTRGGIASSAVLHVGALILLAVGLPNLFHHPPPEEQPIAVDLVMIAPDTKATHPNPYKPKPEAKPEPPLAAPAPKPEPKPEPPPPAPQPPAAVAAPPPPPPPPEPAKSEAKAPPVPPPPPPKPVEAQAPPLPPPLPRPPEPKPKPEIRQAHHVSRPAPPAKADPSAFDNLLKNLEQQQPPRPTAERVKHLEQKPQKPAFDALLQNLTKEQTAEADEAPPAPHRMAATAPPSSQPKAPLGSQLSASDIDLVRERLRPCFNPPFGAKEKPDLVADIRVVMNSDGTVQQARVVDTGQYNSDQIYRAVADAGIRALRNEHCSPLPLPADRFDVWQTFTFGFSTRDMQ